MDDKDLALAIDFKKAPAEVQAAATAHYANVKTVSKLRNQLTVTNQKLSDAERASEASAKALRVSMNAWTPEA